MPWRATSRAIVFVNAMTPPFVAEYTASPEEPTRPASEAMLTMRPDLRSIIASSTARLQLIGPFKLMAMIRSHSSSVESTNGLMTSMPALLTRMSGGPTSARTRSRARSTLADDDTSSATPMALPASVPAVEAAASPSRSATTTVAPASANRLGDGGADAARRAGDESDGSVEAHGSISFRHGHSLVGPVKWGARFSRCDAKPSRASGPPKPKNS